MQSPSSQFNLNLLFYVSLSDKEKIESISLLLKRISRYKPNRLFTRKKSKRLTSSSSLKFLHRQTYDFSINSDKFLKDDRRASLKLSPRASSSPYSTDQILTLNNVFMKISENFKDTSWVKDQSGKTQEIHLVLLKQFLLDSGIADSKLFSCILEPVKGKFWISAEDFVKCIEELHLGYRWKFFATSRIKKHENENIRKQKHICNKNLVFFSLVGYEKGEYLDKESIHKVINFAEHQNHLHLDLITEFYFQKAASSFNSSFHRSLESLLHLAQGL